MDDRGSLAAFLAGRPPGRFGHREHVRVAFAAIRLHGPDAGADLVADGLRRLAATHGHAEHYHETITRFWLRLVAHCVDTEPGLDEFDRFVERFPLLLDGSLLGRHWSREALSSSTARARWLEPDLLALP
jgi:hypothetical protein